MNLVLQSIAGITIAAVGEAFSLADRASLEIKDVMEILSLTSMSSELIKEKGLGKFIKKIKIPDLQFFFSIQLS